MWVDHVQIGREMKTQVGVGGDLLKNCVSERVEEGGCRVPCPAHDVAFCGIETHAPSLCPLYQTLEVLLEGKMVAEVLDLPVDEAVICEEMHLGFDCLQEVVDVAEEQEWA